MFRISGFRSALRKYLLIPVFILASTTLLCAQFNTNASNSVPTGWTSTNGPNPTRQGATIHVKVFDEDKKPLKQQALVRIISQDNGRVVFQTTRNSETEFPNMQAGKYLLEVGASGFLGMHEQISLADIYYDATEQVILSRDPAAVDLALKDANQLPSKTRKDAEKGLRALQLSNFLEASNYLEKVNRQAPNNASVKFLLGYLALQQKDYDHELSYLMEATKLDPQNAQAHNLLGQLYYRKNEYAKAVAAEQIVVTAHAQSAIAHKILANSYLQLRQYENARVHAHWMVERGGSEGASANLVLGQALAGLRRYDEAISALSAYLEAEPANATTAKVRTLVATLQKDKAQPNAPVADVAIGDPSLNEESAATAMLGMPADVDSQSIQVARAVQCPANILQMAADRSNELVDHVAQFSAIEDMVHETLTPQGTPRNRETRKFNYLVSITEPPQGPLIVQEYRGSAGGILDMPEQINTTGLAVLAIAFHPKFQEDFDMKCEGLGDWNGQPAWLVHFRQKEDRPSRLRTYVVSGSNFPVRLKGRAWLSADTFQMLHLESDLVRSVPEIRLMAEHTSVSYGPVTFKKSNTDLWLPKNADLYVNFNKHRFHRNESFDHFMLFATDATDKPNLPTSSTKTGLTEDHGGGPHQF